MRCRYNRGIFLLTSNSSGTRRCGGLLSLETLLRMHLCFPVDMVSTTDPQGDCGRIVNCEPIVADGNGCLSRRIGMVPLMTYVFQPKEFDANNIGGLTHASLNDKLKPREVILFAKHEVFYNFFTLRSH